VALNFDQAERYGSSNLMQRRLYFWRMIWFSVDIIYLLLTS
jgi:hypothetical protein